MFPDGPALTIDGVALDVYASAPASLVWFVATLCFRAGSSAAMTLLSQEADEPVFGICFETKLQQRA